MAPSNKLRDAVCKKLGIKPRQLHNRISAKARQAGITDRVVALLLIAHEEGIDVTKPRFQVLPGKIEALNDYLRSQKQVEVIAPVLKTARRKGATKPNQIQSRRLLSFKGKYPEVFYDRLEEEINTAYNNPKLPNAVLMLSRKLIENLVYNLLEYKFGKKGQINLYYNTARRRAHDFSVLIENLDNNKSRYDVDQQDLIDEFLEKVKPFKRDANSKVHKVVDYLDSMRQIKKLEIPEMTQILLKLISRVK